MSPDDVAAVFRRNMTALVKEHETTRRRGNPPPTSGR